VAKIPFSTARDYYGPSLSDPRDQPDFWSNYPRKVERSTPSQFANLGIAAGIVGSIAAAGYLPFRKGHLWDVYSGLAKGFEEYSPAKFLRTFQVSKLLSPFETSARNAILPISAQSLLTNKQQAEYLSRIIGPGSYPRLVKEGVTLRGNRLFWGQGQDVALKRAAVILSPEHGGVSRIGAGYARSLGMTELKGFPEFGKFFSTVKPFEKRDIFNPAIRGEAAQIIGGKNIFQHQWRKLAGLGTEQIERFNRLLEMTPKVGKYLGVKRAGGLKMLGALSLKYGVGLGALGLGYEYLDWKARQSEALDETLFSEGITYGLATLPVKAHLMAAQASEALGLQDYARGQEEMAPGSTSLMKLAAFPFMGAAGVGTAAYFTRTAKMAQLQIAEGISASMAAHRIGEAFKSWDRFGGFIENIGRSLEKRGGLLGKIKTPVGFGMAVGAGIGLAAVLPFLPGALIPQKSSEELKAIYSGEQEVAIKKGRWWELGRQPYEGSGISYFRPHAYSLLGSRAREKGIWGEDYETLNPIERWYKKTFTYELEAKHYKERPYPVTGRPFEDVPFIGPILSATVGRLFKPTLYMHTSEWLSDKGIKTQPPGFGARIATEIGQIPQGIPIAPGGIASTVGEQIYRIGTEMVGFTGFTAAAIKEKITGSQDWFDQIAELESASRITSYEREYWERDLGGLAGLSEAWRRLYPHRRRQIDLANPIRNTLPDWLPGAGEKSPNFLIGDPYTKVPFGETRLPGPGLEALYPELRGVAAEDYSASWKHKILGDIAPYTDKYKQSLRIVRAARKESDWSEAEEQRFQNTMAQVKARKQKKEFNEYKYLTPMGDIPTGAKAESSELMIAMNEMKAAGVEKPSMFDRVFGGYWELLSHNAETAFDQMTPVSPGAKLVHQRTAIEDYEREILYGQSAAFWQHPVTHFMAPFARSMGHAFGFEGVPAASETTRNIEEQFDVLKYVKNARLANVARMAGDTMAVKEFENNKNETMFGINPFTRNYSNLLRALPRRERDYFTSFEQADSIEERQRILEMVPENEKSLYIARWKLTHADQLKKAIKAEVLTEDQQLEADRQIKSIYKEAATEGFPTSDELMAEFLQTKASGENYADWYRRVKILGNMRSMPGPDWTGWHPSVDLEDIKLKLVNHLGEEPIPLNLWPSRAAELPYKPFISEESIAPLIDQDELTSEEIKARVNDLLFTDKMRGDTFITSTVSEKQEVALTIDIEEDTTEKQERLLVEALSA
jgi:hypothetical protein